MFFLIIRVIFVVIVTALIIIIIIIFVVIIAKAIVLTFIKIKRKELSFDYCSYYSILLLYSCFTRNIQTWWEVLQKLPERDFCL